MTESQDIARLRQEQKENQNRDEYIYLLDDLEGALQDLFIQANRDSIETDDILEKVKLMIEDTQDIKIKVERV